VRGALFGISHGADRAALTRAVLEGVTFALADCNVALSATGTRIERLLAVGGGAASEYWLAAIATALGVPVDVPASAGHGAAFGAARLGLMAADGAGAEILTRPPIARTIEPDQNLAQAFADGHARFRAAYGAAKMIP
ncbi:MAG: FGGY-family carbohydrate kinase, partial [Pseudomonadota bacterium]